ncbi:MAG: hypothetical protein EA424_26075 [Planctomycetaceae bacterium]|nr:MAG: hypothetical protein EA424_26075 [Planctomycetaceae bacterium]
MQVRFFVQAIVTAILFYSLTHTATAQWWSPPAGPTITPQLDHFSRPVGMLDTYHTFIRPRAELRSRLIGLDAAVTQQDRRLDQINHNLMQTSSSQTAPTGTGSSFMNHSHFYPGLRPMPRTRDRSGFQQRAW